MQIKTQQETIRVLTTLQYFQKNVLSKFGPNLTLIEIIVNTEQLILTEWGKKEKFQILEV